MPTTASPALAPLLASEIVAPAVLLRGETSPIPEGILELGANAVISSASTPADAAARSVASSAALNLLQEVVQAGPLTAGNPSRLVFDDGLMLSLLPAVAGARVLNVDDAEFARTNMPPPPIRGALPSAQPVAAGDRWYRIRRSRPPCTICSPTPMPRSRGRRCCRWPRCRVRPTPRRRGSIRPRRDGISKFRSRHRRERRWRSSKSRATAAAARSKRPNGCGGRGSRSTSSRPVRSMRMVSLSGDRTSVRMWAERPATAEQLRAGVSQLSQALSRAELQPGDIVIRDGAPLQSASAPAGHFLDRAL